MQRCIRSCGRSPLHCLTQAPCNLMGRNSPKVKTLATAEDRCGQLLGLCGRQDETHMGRRLFQRLEQRVEGRGGQHVHLVDDIDLELAMLGRILDRLAQVANFIHAIVGGSVDFHHVHGFLCQQTAAALALSARIAVDRLLTVDGAGHDLRGGRFTRAAAATKQISMGNAAGGD